MICSTSKKMLTTLLTADFNRFFVENQSIKKMDIKKPRFIGVYLLSLIHDFLKNPWEKLNLNF